MYKQEEFTNGEYGTEETLQEAYVLNEPQYLVDIGAFNEIMPSIMQMTSQEIENNLPLSEGMLLTPSQLEDTMDVAQASTPVLQELIPISPTGPPNRTVFAGDYDFQVEINAKHTNKKKYLYSHLLNRIYVDIKTSFAVTFRWSPLAGGGGGLRGPAYVRACVVFSDESQAEKRVERCTQHTHDPANQDINRAIVLNVLHSSRELGTAGVHYCGAADRADSWLSVVVELSGHNGGSHAYQFVCKNSCSSGINRRSTDIIFTLEDVNGNVYGRQMVGARACSCPRRDMNTDHERADAPPGKRRVTPAPPAPAPTVRVRTPPPPAKRVKLETDAVDDDTVILPPLRITSRRAAIAGLEVMASVMEAANERARCPAAAARLADLRAHIADLRRPQ